MSRGRALRLPEAALHVGLKPKTVSNLMTLGRFPKPHKQGRVNVWFADELDAFNRRTITGYDEVHAVDP